MRFERLKEDIRRWGLGRAALVRVVRRVENFLGLRTFVVHVRTLDPDRLPDHVPDGASARLLTEEELLEFAHDPGLEMSPGAVRMSCDRGDVCFGYLEGTALVAYSWYATRPTRAEMGLWVRFRSGYSYGYRSFTRPSHRGRHLQECLTHLAEHWRATHGARFNIGYIDMLNLSSIKADRRYGNRAVGYVACMRWFGRTRAFHSPGAKRCGFEFFTPALNEVP